MVIDQNVLKGLKKGNPHALEKIYLVYNSRVYNFIYSMIKDSVVCKDLTQDVFLQLWNKRGDVDCSGNFNGYLFTIAKNTVYMYLRRELLMQNYLQKMEDEAGQQDLETEQKLDNVFFRENVMTLIEELPEARKNIFLLYWKSEMSYREIAELLSISEKTVATQVRRTLRFLYERLDKGLLLALLYSLTNGW
ncbi:MAG: RNA polymerase sigma-70 factor [Bacteroides sp.]|nr:RNA polymerase sigma-70 factor [Bacteroides sp.]